MAINVLTEHLLDPRETAKLPPFCRGGKAAHFSKIHRVMRHGARDANGDRVRLEFVRVPGGIRTSREAVQRFIRRLTDPNASERNNAAADAREHAHAEKVLAGAGI